MTLENLLSLMLPQDLFLRLLMNYVVQDAFYNLLLSKQIENKMGKKQENPIFGHIKNINSGKIH